MKQFYTLGIVLSLMTLPVAANAAKYGTAGCGIGALAFEDQAGMIQIVAATLNGTFASQTFGITTGTSHCVPSAGLSASLDQELYLKSNYANVMRDAAAGDGEYLATFATLLGCEASAHPRFFDVTQSNHTQLFDEDSHTTALKNVKRAVAADEALSASCARI